MQILNAPNIQRENYRNQISVSRRQMLINNLTKFNIFVNKDFFPCQQ